MFFLNSDHQHSLFLAVVVAKYDFFAVSRSPVFNAMFAHNMAEAQTKESCKFGNLIIIIIY